MCTMNKKQASFWRQDWRNLKNVSCSPPNYTFNNHNSMIIFISNSNPPTHKSPYWCQTDKTLCFNEEWKGKVAFLCVEEQLEGGEPWATVTWLICEMRKTSFLFSKIVKKMKEVPVYPVKGRGHDDDKNRAMTSGCVSRRVTRRSALPFP